MKMKTLIALLIAVGISGLFCGCGQANNQLSCRNAVLKEMGCDDVQQLPNKNFTFIVRTANGEIWVVECMSFTTPEVTSKTKLFGAR